MAAAASSKWGAAGWWFVLVISLPFCVYCIPFAINDFDTYKEMTIATLDQQFDIAGHHIRDHHVTWQIHATMAIVFIVTGLFQFAPKFRKAYPVIHRRMGYAFAWAAMVQCFTGMVIMTPVCEFHTFGRAMFLVMGLDLFISTCIAVQSAREKKFKVHQRWMIRAAAVGYAVIGVRIWMTLLLSTGMYLWHVTELAPFLAFVSFKIPPEIYIRTHLSDKKKEA